MYVCMYVFVCLVVCLFVCLFIYLFICLFVCLFVCLHMLWRDYIKNVQGREITSRMYKEGGYYIWYCRREGKSCRSYLIPGWWAFHPPLCPDHPEKYILNKLPLHTDFWSNHPRICVSYALYFETEPSEVDKLAKGKRKLGDSGTL